MLVKSFETFKIVTTSHSAKHLWKNLVAIVIMSVPDPFNGFYEMKESSTTNWNFRTRRLWLISHWQSKILVINISVLKRLIIVKSLPNIFGCSKNNSKSYKNRVRLPLAESSVSKFCEKLLSIAEVNCRQECDVLTHFLRNLDNYSRVLLLSGGLKLPFQKHTCDIYCTKSETDCYQTYHKTWWVLGLFLCTSSMVNG